MIMNEAHIAGIGTALPYPISTRRFLEVDEMMRKHLGQPQEVIDRLKSYAIGSGIDTRHYVHPHWLSEDDSPDNYPDAIDVALKKDIFTPYDFVPPHWERMCIFQDTAVKLAIKSARNAVNNWGGNVKDITHIITTCTTGWSEPGIAVAVMQDLELSLNCQKAELNFNGCFCGATCLRLARDTIRAGNAKAVLVVATEVASTHYDLNATDPGSLVSHALFADGSSAFILAPEGQWRYKETGMSLVPDSAHLLGLVPPLTPDQSGYRMILDPDVSDQLGKYFRQGPGKEILKKLDCDGKSKPALAIHPGGPKILDSVGDVFSELGWPNDAMQSSYDSLHRLGNLGAAAILFVLANRLSHIEQDQLVTMAFGPGVTVEWAELVKVG